MLTRRLSPLAIVTLILVAIIVIGLRNPGLVSFFAVLFALLVASVIMLLHLVLAWRRLTVTARLSVLMFIVAWLAMFYGMVQAF